jgi:hypothetical protein
MRNLDTSRIRQALWPINNGHEAFCLHKLFVVNKLRINPESFSTQVGAEIAVFGSNYVVVDIPTTSREQCKDPAGDG